MIAGAFRSFGNSAVACYLPVYFQQVYPEFATQYSILSALSLLIFGFSSVLLGGIIGDKYGQKNHMTNALICMLGALFAIPTVMITTLYRSNFWLAMSMSAITIFVSGSFYSPAITMMQNTSSKSNSGNVVSSYTFYTTIAQILSPAIFN